MYYAEALADAEIATAAAGMICDEVALRGHPRASSSRIRRMRRSWMKTGAPASAAHGMPG